MNRNVLIKFGSPVAITIGVAGLGFLTNFAASVLFDSLTFGWFIVLSSQVAFWAAVSSFGFAGYFLGHIKQYIEEEKFLVLFPSFMVCLTGMVFLLVSELDFLKLAFFVLLICTVFSNSFVLMAQVDKKPYLIAVYQSAPTIIKSLAVLVCYFCILSSNEKSPEKAMFYLKIMLIFFSIVCLLALTIQFFHYLQHKKFKRPSLLFIKDISFYGSWASVVGSFAFATAVPGLVAYKTSAQTSAYFGVYMLFWSILSTLTVSLVTNKYMYQLAHAVNSRDVGNIFSLFQAAKVASIRVSIFIYIFTSLLALFFSELIWVQLVDIKLFLILISFVLVLKSIQSLTGMIIGFPEYILRKVIIQFVCFAIFGFLLFASKSPNIVAIGSYLLFSEFLMALGFLIFSRYVLRLFKTNCA